MAAPTLHGDYDVHGMIAAYEGHLAVREGPPTTRQRDPRQGP